MTTNDHRSAGTGPNDIAKAIEDAAHVVIGFGVIGWNKLQVGRRELMKDFTGKSQRVETHLDAAKVQLAGAVRDLDARFKPVRQDLDDRLEKMVERLPGKAREVFESAREIARDTERQVRQAVGAQ